MLKRCGVFRELYSVSFYFLVLSFAYAEEAPLELSPFEVQGLEKPMPETMTYFRQQDIVERGIGDIKDVIHAVPNMYIADLGMGSYGNIFNVRGLTNTRLFSEPSMVFYVDDVPYGSSMAYVGDFFDIAEIDIYRSPQAGLFGKNAYGGAFNLTSQAPVNKLKASASVEFAEYEQYRVSARASGALIKDQLYFNLAGLFKQRSGFLYNQFLNSRSDNIENFSGNFALTWTPDKDWNIRFSAGLEDFDYGASRFVRLDSDDFFTVHSNEIEQLQQRSNYQALRISYQFDESELLSVTSRRFWEMDPRVADLDLTPVTILSRSSQLDEQTWSQEFRWRSTVQENAWNWNVGAFFSNRQRSTFFDTNFLGARFINDIKQHETNSYALFGHLVYQGFEHLTLSADLRFDYVQNSSISVGSFDLPNTLVFSSNPSNDSFFVSPTIRLDYTYSPHLLIYAATGLGYKPAGIASTSVQYSEYQKETLWHNQLGFKTNAFQQRLQVNLAMFYYDIKDYQLERFFTLVEYSISNAAKVSSYGLELETQALLTESIQLQANLGYTHSRFEQYHDPVTGQDYSANVVPYVPDFNALVALQYKHPQGYFARAEWLWIGDTYFDDANSEIFRENDYSLANLRIGYQQAHYSIYAFANNITDTRYYTFKLGGVDRGAPGNPRMVGVRLAVAY